MRKEIILNWDVVLVFLPLVLIAFSSETLSIRHKSNCKILRPYNFVDIFFKFLAYISSQLIYRHIVKGAFFWISIIIFAICVVISIICSIFMIKLSKE